MLAPVMAAVSNAQLPQHSQPSHRGSSAISLQMTPGAVPNKLRSNGDDMSAFFTNIPSKAMLESPLSPCQGSEDHSIKTGERDEETVDSVQIPAPLPPTPSSLLAGSLNPENQQQTSAQHHVVPDTNDSLTPSGVSSAIASSAFAQLLPHLPSDIKLPSDIRLPSGHIIFRRLDSSLPPLTRQRFQDLVQFFNPSLSKELQKEKVVLANGSVAIELRMVGKTERQARPTIVVTCGPKIFRKVTKFFRKSHIQKHYQPEDKNSRHTHFEIVFVNLSPIMASLEKLPAYLPERSILGSTADGSAFNGVSVMVKPEDEKPRVATLGGLIVVTVDGTSYVYGMTVGHLISTPDGIPGIPALSDSEDEDRDETEESDDEDDSDIEIQSGIGLENNYRDRDENAGHNTLNERSSVTNLADLDVYRQPCSHADDSGVETLVSTNNPWLKIGTACRHPVNPPEQQYNLDWGLIEASEDGKTFSLEMLQRKDPSIQKHLWSRIEFPLAEDSLARIVTMRSGPRGSKDGLLTFGTSYVALRPGTLLTRVHTFSLVGSSKIELGDCGSWVIDRITSEVYGHVVASSPFGDAYIIPIQDSFKQIKSTLGASRVGLTLPTEFTTLEQKYFPILYPVISDKISDPQDTLATEFKEIVGAILALASPLSVPSLSGLLSICEPAINRMLQLLHSVLEIPLSQYSAPIRVLDLSFRDFLFDERLRSNTTIFRHFWIDDKESHRKLYNRCVELMSSSSGLRRNMCCLSSPGITRQEIDPSLIEKSLPLEVRYACRYWLYHLEKSGDNVSDGGPLHKFLQNHVLYWLEAISLLEAMGEVVSIMEALSLRIEIENGKNLLTLVQDIKRFVIWNQYIINKAPLQTYYSAIVFAPKRSIVRGLFEAKERIKWAKQLPWVQDEWDGLLHTLQGHTGQVISVAFSPDDKTVASASYDRTVRLWDAATGAAINTLRGHMDRVNGVVFSPDGKMVASASDDRTVRLWDAATGAAVNTLHGHTNRINSVAFSPDGKTVASASRDRTVRLWNVAIGHTLRRYRTHDYPNSLYFSKDGRHISTDGESFLVTHTTQSTFDSLGHDDKGQNQDQDQDQLQVILIDDNWLIRGGEKLLWLPPAYRPSCSAVAGNRICLGHASGGVSFLTLAP